MRNLFVLSVLFVLNLGVLGTNAGAQTTDNDTDIGDNTDAPHNMTYSFRLNRSDSATFSSLTKAFEGPKEVRDPEFPEVLYKKYWFESKNAAVTIGCKHMFSGEKELAIDCDFDFIPSLSTSDVDAEVMARGIVRATIRDTQIATKIYQSLDMSPYTSNEWVRVFVADRPEERPRVKVACEATSINATTARKCTIDVVLN